MDIGKVVWDRYMDSKRDLVFLERDHADLEERILAARARVTEFEVRGINYDLERGLICINVEQASRTASAGSGNVRNFAADDGGEDQQVQGLAEWLESR